MGRHTVLTDRLKETLRGSDLTVHVSVSLPYNPQKLTLAVRSPSQAKNYKSMPLIHGHPGLATLSYRHAISTLASIFHLPLHRHLLRHVLCRCMLPPICTFSEPQIGFNARQLVHFLDLIMSAGMSTLSSSAGLSAVPAPVVFSRKLHSPWQCLRISLIQHRTSKCHMPAATTIASAGTTSSSETCL